MKLLVIGGTRFLGRHLVALALERGHAVTLLHRGRSGAGLFPEAQHHIADRNGDLSVLDAGRWDAVLDTSGYVPRQVRSVAGRLAGRVGRYLFVSSISVYDSFTSPGVDENAPVRTLADPATEAVTGDTYGGLKALCEQALAEALPGAALVARPGLLVGPHDPTGRFTWWLQRMAAGGTVLAPGDPAAPVQCIDVRDAAAWLLQQAEHGTTGTFNLTGPAQPLSLGSLLETVRQTLAPEATLLWADEDFLLRNGVAPWTELPLWVPRSEAGLHAVDISRALATGLACRPLVQTITDTAAWASAHDGPHPGVGLLPDREARLIAAWRGAA